MKADPLIIPCLPKSLSRQPGIMKGARHGFWQQSSEWKGLLLIGFRSPGQTSEVDAANETTIDMDRRKSMLISI